MRWEDLEEGNVPRDFLDQFFASLPREMFVNMIKIDPRFQKEFAGFRLDHISPERFAQRLAPYFYKEKAFRRFLLEEWVFSHQELISTLENLYLSQLKKELPLLSKKHGIVSLYLALLFDGRKGTDKLSSQLWQEACQNKLWEDRPEEATFPVETKKRLEETGKKIEELEDQRDRLYMEIEAEKDRRSNLEDKFFSLKRENKASLERLKELEAQKLRLTEELNLSRSSESKSSEYLSQIHGLNKQVEKLEHEIQKERKNKEEIEGELLGQLEVNEKLKKELFFCRHQVDLLQAIFILPELDEKGIRALPGTLITVVCGEVEVPSSFFKIANSWGLSLLLHSSRIHDNKLESYLDRSHCVFLFGKQLPESFKEIVRTLCYSRQLACFEIPSVKEEVFEGLLKALCTLAVKKGKPGKKM
jgi:hypothetical protein